MIMATITTAIKISMNDFSSFLMKNGAARMTSVRTTKYRPPYHPSRDYWKKLRDAIVEYHLKGMTDKKVLDKVVLNVREEKQQNHRDMIAFYKRFLGRKEIKYHPISSRKWRNKNLVIAVNPELIFEIKGISYIIKLHFKKDKLTQRKIESTLALLKNVYASEIAEGAEVAMLDIRRNKLFTPKSPKNLMTLLGGEANSFEHIWNTI
jgi:hypothetical protein